MLVSAIILPPVLAVWNCDIGMLILFPFTLIGGTLIMPPIAVTTTIIGTPTFFFIRLIGLHLKALRPKIERRAAGDTLFIAIPGPILLSSAVYGYVVWDSVFGLAFQT